MGYVSVVLTDICRSFLRVSKVTEKIKTRSKPTPSENFNSHPLYVATYGLNFEKSYALLGAKKWDINITVVT
jgi:hypothetical protein